MWAPSVGPWLDAEGTSIVFLPASRATAATRPSTSICSSKRSLRQRSPVVDEMTRPTMLTPRTSGSSRRASFSSTGARLHNLSPGLHVPAVALTSFETIPMPDGVFTGALQYLRGIAFAFSEGHGGGITDDHYHARDCRHRGGSRCGRVGMDIGTATAGTPPHSIRSRISTSRADPGTRTRLKRRSRSARARGVVSHPRTVG